MKIVINPEELRKMLVGCNTFTERTADGTEHHYYGGYYLSDNSGTDVLNISVDYLRPYYFKKVLLKDIEAVNLQEGSVEIKLSDGTVLYGAKSKLIESTKCCFKDRLFNDKQIIEFCGDVAVVSLYKLLVPLVKRRQVYVDYYTPPAVVECSNSLTFAYTREGVHGIYIGFFDIDRKKFIEPPEPFAFCLDIGI